MARVVITGAADADAAAIVDDLTAKAGANVAARYDADFDAFYRRLQQFPESGAPRRKLGATVRLGVVFPYVVFYRYVEADDAVLVLRLLHGRRKVTRRMLQQPSSQRRPSLAARAYRQMAKALTLRSDTPPRNP